MPETPPAPADQRTVTVLGSTGSIGTQALDLIARHPDAYRVAGLAAGGGDVGLLVEQARAVLPKENSND